MIKKPAGLRTHILVAMGSTLFTILSLYGFQGSDPARVAAYVVAGIGFIGGGSIIQSRDRVIGITTAASLFATAAIGMAIGVGFYLKRIRGGLHPHKFSPSGERDSLCRSWDYGGT